MLDRRGFLAAMLGAATAPRDVLAGISTPAPVAQAVGTFARDWVCVWSHISPIKGDTLLDGKPLPPLEVKMYLPRGLEEEFLERRPGIEIVKVEPIEAPKEV